MSVFYIDGKAYDIGVVVPIQRSALLKADSLTSGEMLDHSIRTDVVGTFYSYAITIQPKGNNAAYDALYEDLTAPIGRRTFSVPYGQSSLEFTGRIDTVADTLTRALNGVNTWRGLTVTFIPDRPQRLAP